jgi:hypothetical protein
MVTGTKIKEAYFTEEVKTVLRVCRSVLGSSLENAGKRTVDIGYVKKTNNIEKLEAIL